MVFTYGSLMFPEVIEIILDRHIASEELRNAVLEDHRRTAIPERPYPTGIRASGFCIEGKILGPITQKELECLDAYEESFYVRIPVSVRVDGKRQDALAYIDGRDPLPFAMSEWDPESFEREHLPSFLKKLRVGWSAEERQFASNKKE